MKTRIITVLLLLYSGCVLIGQEVYSPVSIPSSYYDEIKPIILSMMPDETEVINIQSSELPADFEEILLSHDWYEVGNYFFKSKEFSSDWGNDLEKRESLYGNNQFKFIHYSSDGKAFNMHLNRLKDGTLTAEYGYLPVKDAPVYIGIEVIDGKKHIVTESRGRRYAKQIMAYKDGVLYAKSEAVPNAATSKFHIAYIGVKKAFD